MCSDAQRQALSQDRQRLAGRVVGDMRFPDDDTEAVTVRFELWEEEVSPFKVAILNLNRMGGNLIINFENLGDFDDPPWIMLGFANGRICMNLMVNGESIHEVQIPENDTGLEKGPNHDRPSQGEGYGAYPLGG